MSPLRRFSQAISSSLFRLLVFTEATVITFVLLFGQSSGLKDTLIDKKVYERFVPSVIQANIDSKQSDGSIPFEDKQVQAIINQSFTPKSLQKNTETVIDAAYTWLNGRTDALQFSIDFTTNKRVLADKLSSYAFDKLEFQPFCTVPPTDLDPFNATCRPVGLDITGERQRLADEIFNNENFLPNPIITEANLPKDKDGKNVLEKLKLAPTGFQLLLKAPWILGVVTILMAIISVMLHPSRRKGWKQLSYGTVGNGFFLILSPLVFGLLLPYFTRGVQSSLGGGGTQAIIEDVVTGLSRDFNVQLINLGVQVLGAGVLMVALERFTRPLSSYSDVNEKAGIVTSMAPRQKNGRYKLNPETVPVQSSEHSRSRKIRKKPNPKYRKIPKKEI